uniref:Nucleolar complex protein 2 homolog n=1 Tax=Setaria digitata TaxID=48799 RepID=A0A915Q6K6_9BILA
MPKVSDHLSPIRLQNVIPGSDSPHGLTEKKRLGRKLLVEILMELKVMGDVEDMNRNGEKVRKRQGNALQTCSKRRKVMKDGKVCRESTRDDGEELTLSGYKKQLDELAEEDPQFYKFLKEEESDLLNFDESDSDVERENLQHKAESEDENETFEESSVLRRDLSGRKVIDSNFIKNLQNLLLQEGRPEPSTVQQAIAAFTACVARVGANIEPPRYVINDGDVFESVVRLCFSCVGKSLFSLVGHVKTEANEEGKESKFRKSRRQKLPRHWKKYCNLIKTYLHALLQFLNEIQTPDVIVCTIRAVTDLIELYIYFPKLTRDLIKGMVKIWSRRTDESRCAAFLALYRLVKLHKKSFPAVIKGCYLGYVMNVRDVKSESWPLIILMQKSFAELCMIYPEIAYQYAFVYIRQTAIHLRNATIAKRKDLIQTIYNWQFMQCLYLWSQVIAKAHRHHISTKTGDTTGIEELAYPLCQITISTMKLFPSLKYFPLRIHCLRILLIVQQNCHIYIPTLSLAVELLSNVLLMLKKKPTKGKGPQRSNDMKCVLKVSAAHLDEAAFRQAAVGELFRIHLEAAHVIQHSCAFADIVIPINHEIKTFTKNCRSTECSRLFKSLETKIQQQAVYARGILNSIDVDLTNEALLRHLERRFRAPDAPLTKFYDSWEKMWELRENARSYADQTISVQHPISSNPIKNATMPMKAEPVTEVRTDKVEKKSSKQQKRIHQLSVPANKGDEDVLEDLVLSDIED